MPLKFLVCGLAAALFGFASLAQAQTLGGRWEEVRRLHRDALPVTINGARALELREADYAGHRWQRIDFVFDREGRLVRMSMTTAEASYDEVLRLASASESAPPTLSEAETLADRETQIRICQSADGRVTVTYEPASVIS